MSEIGKLNKTFVLPEKKAQVSQEKLKEVADLYEKHFIKEMMKQMKSTLGNDKGIFKQNNAEKIFQSQLDDEYSAAWNKTGTFGLSQLIFEQLNQKFGAESLRQKSIEKPSGPIDLQQKTEVKQIEALGDYSLQMKPVMSENAEKAYAVKTPWAGTLQSKELMMGDQTLYKIKHDNGLESLITVQGAASEKSRFLSKGDQLMAGDELGMAAKTSPLFWTVRAKWSDI